MEKKRKLGVVESEEIFSTIQSGSIDEFRILFTTAFDVNTISSGCRGNFPMHIAARFGRLDIIEFLLENGVDAKNKDRNGWTPLHYAVKAGRLAVINLFIKISEFEAASNSDTPLHAAAHNRRGKGVKKKVKIKSLLNVANKEGNTPLHIACESGSIDVVSLLLNALEKLPVTERNLSIENKCNCIPLHLACQSRDESVVTLLLDALEKFPETDRKLNSVSKCGNTPLHIACKNGSEGIVSLLLESFKKIPESERNLNIGDVWGNTPLHIACKRGHEVVVRLLLNAIEKNIETERNLSIVNQSGETPLYVACRFGNESVVRLLLNALEKIPETMCNMDERTGCRGDTPLHVACRRGDTSIVSLLLDAGARSDIKNQNGEKSIYLYLLKKQCIREHEFATLKKMSSFTDINDSKMSAAHLIPFYTLFDDFATVVNILHLQKNLNVLDIWGNTPLNYIIEGIKSTENPPQYSYIKIRLLIDYGAYFTPKDYRRIVDYNPAQNELLTDIELCAKSCLNQLLNAAIPAIYNSPLSTRLPPRDNLVSNSVYLRKMKNCVEIEIKRRGYCDFEKIVYPLFYLSVVRLSNYYKKSDFVEPGDVKSE